MTEDINLNVRVTKSVGTENFAPLLDIHCQASYEILQDLTAKFGRAGLATMLGWAIIEEIEAVK